jgi:gliding motility associated protien GldN
MTILNSYRSSVAAAILFFASSTVFAQGSAADPSLPGSQKGVNPNWAPSKTNDGAYDRVSSHASVPIPWQPIRETDILWKKRVWREIDTREKQNVAFRYAGDESSGGGMFIEILVDGLKTGKIKGYKQFDDRFTAELTKQDIMESVAGKTDTTLVVDPTTNEEKQMIVHHDFDPNGIRKYRIKEDWIFDRNQGQMVVRIVGIAPVKDVVGDDGVYRGSQAMFWLYYPDIRNLLAQYEVYNPQNDIARYTWDEFFESRQFASKITKVSNPFGNDFKDNLNAMESLYEGKHAAEEIFNKEVDMWVY